MNSYFAENGLVSMTDARARECQPACQQLSTGEPDAGDPPVRFGGRGAAIQCGFPTPMNPFLSPLPIFPPQSPLPDRTPSAFLRAFALTGSEILFATQRLALARQMLPCALRR